MTTRQQVRPCRAHRSYPAGACSLCDMKIKALVDRLVPRTTERRTS